MGLPLATMGRGAALAMSTFAATVAVAVAIVVAPVVSADPPVQPQAGAPCDAAEPDSQTFANPQSAVGEPEVLKCVGNQGRRWQAIGALERPVQRFYTFGPTETLHPGDVTIGDFWDGVGVTTSDICAEQQTFSDGRTTETKTNNVGQYFGFTVSPQMTSLSLKGNCHWLISPCNGKRGPCTASYAPPGIDERQRYRV
jgi:hypothetical protein